jgi:hypothetical protein
MHFHKIMTAIYAREKYTATGGSSFHLLEGTLDLPAKAFPMTM